MELTSRQQRILSEFLERMEKENNADYINGYDEGECLIKSE